MTINLEMPSLQVVAVDPGPEQSAYVVWNGAGIEHKGIVSNEELLKIIPRLTGQFVIEQVRSYGMTVGAAVFDTVFWSGRLCQAWLQAGGDRPEFILTPRITVKMHVCQDSRAKDTNIRQALIDRFGAPGTKKAPGVTYGLKKDLWQAFALAVTYYDEVILSGERYER